MESTLWLMLGCALGGVARLWVSTLIARRRPTSFPLGTVVVNVSGALVIGVVAGANAAAGWVADVAYWSFAVIGFLGSYTTVSSFSLQTLLLINDGHVRVAAANVACSLIACIGAAAVGWMLGTALAG
jgi:fluoride exporter